MHLCNNHPEWRVIGRMKKYNWHPSLFIRLQSHISLVAVLLLGSVATSGLGATPYPGYNLFAPLGSTNTYLMGNDGAIFHTWSSSYRPGNSAYLLEDGTLLRTANSGGTNLNVGGAGGRVERQNGNGSLIWAFDYSDENVRQHHDIQRLPNGNILMIAWERKTASEALDAGRDPNLLAEGELWPDHLIEVAPTGSIGGTIVWEWHAWDHLVQDVDPAKANFGVVAEHPERIDLNFTLSNKADWLHINSVAYHAELDQIVLSVHNFSEIWIIDHGTTTAEAASSTGGLRGKGGDLLYRWGNPQAYGAGDATHQQFFVQHNAHWIDEDGPGTGHILVLNNGQGRPGGNASTVDEIVTPLAPDGSYSNTLPFAPAAPAWTYASTPSTSFYAASISGVQRLPNGNTLICNGPTGTFFEVTSAGEIVWQYQYNGAVFRVMRYGLDYSGLAGLAPSLEVIPGLPFALVDSGQTNCYNTNAVSAAPAPGAAFAGQDAQYVGAPMNYALGTNGLTVQDNTTGLTWTRSPDLNRDGTINATDKLTHASAIAYAASLNSQNFGGFSDWRLPSIKELYSLMNFSGIDMSGPNPATFRPFIDTNFFAFGYGDTNAGERLIDAQFASTTLYVDTVMNSQSALFGLNLADGRIKGYPTLNKTYYVYYVRGNTSYGVNAFIDNGDGTVTDLATGLLWQQADSGIGMDWQAAMDTAENLNLAGWQDWRLPNAKELQSIVDYTRAPGVTASAAIDPVFACTAITNEAGTLDYPWFWSSTTHANLSTSPGKSGVYVCFGRALGYMNGMWMDVHGAGCQRSDPKGGSLTNWTFAANGYYSAQAPQGDAIRISNFVRCVRSGTTPPATDSDSDGIPDWTEYDYTTNAMSMSATGDLDGDGIDNLSEIRASTSPIDDTSLLVIESVASNAASNPVVSWKSALGATYTLRRSTHLVDDSFSAIVASHLPATPPLNIHTDAPSASGQIFYLISVE